MRTTANASTHCSISSLKNFEFAWSRAESPMQDDTLFLVSDCQNATSEKGSSFTKLAQRCCQGWDPSSHWRPVLFEPKTGIDGEKQGINKPEK